MSQALGFYNAGTQALASGSLTSAVDLLRRATRGVSEPEIKSSAWRNLGIALRRCGDEDGAIEAFTAALSIDEDDVKARYSLGNVLVSIARHDEAIAAFQAVRLLSPDFAQAANNEGAAWMALGRAGEAEECFSAAVRIDPSFAHAWGNLGAARAALGRHAAPLHTFQKALSLSPDDTGIRCQMGHLLTELGHFDAAIRTFKMVLKAEDQHADARAGLSLALHRQGDTVGALAQIAPAIATGAPHPDEAVAYARICMHMDQPENAVAVLEGALERCAQPATRILIGKQLGQILDALGETDAAFEAIARANTLRGLDFNAAENRSRIDQVISSHQAATSTSNCSDETPVFIVGIPRSGTTLIEQMLDGHPDIYGAGERGDLQVIAGKMHGLELSEKDLDSLAATYLKRIRTLAPQAVRIIDKMPNNFMALGEAARLFPRARVIHCVRDPADTGLSCLFQHFKDTLPWATRQEDIAAFVGDYRRLMEYWAEHCPLRMMTVPYEALVNNPEDWGHRLTSFLGLKFSEAVLRPQDNKRVVRTASFDQVRRPIHSRSVGRFQAYQQHIPRLIELRHQMAQPE